jgi:glycerophosphoryl diester phosphodiesterase
MPHTPEIFAHRGARCAAPENTLPAFAAALDMGADGIELDVHCTADGQLVVIHDFSVNKTTDGQGEVSRMCFAEIARLDAGSHFAPAFAGTRVPTLEAVLDLVGSRCRINIEIKSMNLYAHDASDAVAAVIRQRSLYEQVIVSSFNPITLIKMRHLDARILLGMLYDDKMPPFFRQFWAGPPLLPQAQHPQHRLVDAEYMGWARAIGAQVNTWTVNDPTEAQRLAALGVTTLITDVPDVLIASLSGGTYG